MKIAAGILVPVVCVAVGFAGFWWLAPRSASFGLFEAGETSETVMRIGLSFGATLAGVILGSLYRGLKTMRDRGITKIPNVRRFIGESFRTVDMWLGLITSPLVYALLLQSSSGMSLAGLVVTGLQNGFCCLIIANSLLEPRSTAAPLSPPVPASSSAGRE